MGNVSTQQERRDIRATFRPGQLGITATWADGLVQDVEEGGQADSLGVKPGMYFESIDDIAYTEDLLDLRAAGKTNYEITFTFPQERTDSEDSYSEMQRFGSLVSRLECDHVSPRGENAMRATLSIGPNLRQQIGAKQALDECRIQELRSEAITPVTLHVYAVGHSKTVAKLNTVARDFLKLGGVFHGAIQVFEREWSFAMCADGPGIFCTEPRRCSMHTYNQSVYLGDCKKMPKQVERILREMLPDWQGATYDLLHKNCCTFSDEFAKKLGVGPIPEWVHRFAHTGAVLDDDAKAALHALHEVEDTVLKTARSTMRALSRQEGHVGGEKGRSSCCCAPRK